MTLDTLTLTALPGLPLIQAGDDLPALLVGALRAGAMDLRAGDVLVVAQKIISKAEGRLVALEDVTASPKAIELARKVEKDPRLVELILSESRRIVRALPGLLIVEHRLGFIMANAGIDQSNVAPPGDGPKALLLPRDPDASAAAIAAAIAALSGVRPAVIINDSFGRPWRRGTVGVALGASGLPALVDLRGRPDLFGRSLQASVVALADEAAAAASLLMGQADEARPAVLLRGLTFEHAALPASALLRDSAEDQFR
jgi:coenzyme F420-0:L-glutamate ligase/coenzyme F420-1:gamma-L-glutamate ligase